MKAKHVLAIISLLVLGSGAGYVYDMETGHNVPFALAWINIIIGGIGFIISIIYFNKSSDE
jgi:hypothetical protein